MPKSVVQALLSATQGKLEDWKRKIDQARETKKQELLTYTEKKSQLLPLLIEGHKEGLSTRELEGSDEEDDTDDLEEEIAELDDEIEELSEMLCDAVEDFANKLREIAPH